MKGSAGHILTNLIINWLLGANADRKWEKIYGQRTVEDSQNGLCAKVHEDKEFYQLGFQVCWPWNSGFPATLSITYIARRRHPYIVYQLSDRI